MEVMFFYVAFFSFLVVGCNAFLFTPERTIDQLGKKYDSTLCASLPLASISASDLLSKLMQPSDGAKTLSPIEAVESEIQQAMKGDEYPGGVVLSLVYNNHGILWTKGFGMINISDPSLGAPDQTTKFRIGSITKLFTALQTLMMRDSGQITSLDDDITKYYPEFKVNNPFKTNRGVTFRQLMSHMSGLARNPPCNGLFETGCNITDEQMAKNIAGMRLMYPPGYRPAYSNLAFGLLGKVLANIAGVASWDSLVKKMILDPLGLQNSGNTFNYSDRKNMAVGYYPNGAVADLIDIGWDASAGQMYSSTGDLAKLMTLIFSTNGTTNTQLVDGETLQEWLEPAYVNPDGTGFSYPWELIPLGNYTLRTKDGVLNGYNAEFQMATETKIGFVFLHSCDRCASHRKIITAAQQLLLSASEILEGLQMPPSLPPNPQEYVGVYSATIGKVEVVGNITLNTIFGQPALFTSEGGFTALLEWREDDSFQISLRGVPTPCFVLSTGHIGAWVYFQRDHLGKVVSFTIPGISYGYFYERTTEQLAK